MVDGGGGARVGGARGPRTAEVVDGVLWDYDAEEDDLSPLVATRRYFLDFPWESEEGVRVDPAERGPAEGPR